MFVKCTKNQRGMSALGATLSQTELYVIAQLDKIIKGYDALLSSPRDTSMARELEKAMIALRNYVKKNLPVTQANTLISMNGGFDEAIKKANEYRDKITFTDLKKRTKLKLNNIKSTITGEEPLTSEQESVINKILNLMPGTPGQSSPAVTGQTIVQSGFPTKVLLPIGIGIVGIVTYFWLKNK